MQNYKIYEELGIGNSGAKIYRVRQHGSLVFQAAHEFNTTIPLVAQSIKHQVHLLNQLQHPNIISVQSYFQTETGITLISELCQPYTLQKLVQKDKVLPLNSIAIFSADLRDALSYLHQNQILYNDLCPYNILLNQNGILKFFEFEAASTISRSKPLNSDDIERSIRKCGYMHRAPETLLKDGVYSYASDFFSLGCTLYFLAFNKFPYQDLDNGDYIEYAQKIIQNGQEHLQQNLPPIDSQQQLPQEFYELLFMLLNPIPFQRGTWEQLSKYKLFNVFGEQINVKEHNQPAYTFLLTELCKQNYFGEQFINLQFDKKGKPIQQVIEKEQILEKETNIINALQKQKQMVTQVQQQLDLITDQEVSQGADMTMKQIKKQSQLKFLTGQTEEYYNQLKDTIQGNKFNKEQFMQIWASQVSSIIINRNNQQFKLQPLIAIDTQKQANTLNKSNISQLLSLKIDDFLSSLEVLLKNQPEQCLILFQEQEIFQKYLSHIIEIIKCALSVKLNIPNTSKLNQDDFKQGDILDRIMACLTVILFEYRNQFILLFQQNNIKPFQEVFQLFQTYKMYQDSLTGLTLYCEFLTLVYHFIQINTITIDIFKLQFGINLVQVHNDFLQDIDSKLRNIDLSQANKKLIIQHLSQCIVYYNFCQNNILLTIMLLEQNSLAFNIYKVINYTDFLTVTLNIFMATHEDNFVTQLKQIGGSLINKLFENSTFRASQAIVLLTDIRMSQFLDFNLVTPSYLDFPRVMHDVSATRNILHSLQQCLLIEFFSVIDVFNQRFIISNRKTKRTESFLIQNLFRILNLQQFPAQDDSLLAIVALLLSSILMTDEFLEQIFKNPMNAGNTKLFRFLQIQDIKFDEKLDEMIQRAGIKYKNKFLLQSVSQIIMYFQFFLDINLTAVRSFAITSIYVNQKYFLKCFHCIDIINKLCQPSFQSQNLLFTQKQVQALESILFSLANTIFGIKPPCLAQIPEHKDVHNFYEFADENFYQYVQKLVNLAQVYLNSPWNKQIRLQLYYLSENKKIKGILYSIMSLMKDPYQIATTNQNNKDINKFVLKIFKYIRNEIIQIIFNTIQKYVELGPITPQIYQNTQFIQENDTFTLQGDNLQVGLFQGESFTMQEVESYTDTIKDIITRFIQSKSMFQDIFNQLDRSAQFGLKIGILSVKIIGQTDELYSIVQQTIKGSGIIAKLSSEIIEELIVIDADFWYQQINQINFYKSQPEIFNNVIRTILSQLRIGFQDKIMNNRTKLGDLCRKRKFQFDLQDIITESILSVISYLQKPLLAVRHAINIKAELLVNYFILFSQISNNQDETIPLFKSFGDSIQNNSDLGEELILSLLDLMQQLSAKLIANGWKNFNFVCDQLSQKLTGRVKFRLDQIRNNCIAVEWPIEWFK